MDNMLQICSEASKRLGLGSLSSVAANTNQTAQRLMALLNEAIVALVRRYDWQELKKEVTFLTTATEIQTNLTLPSTYDHIVKETIFNRTVPRRLVGPLTSQEWQQYKALTSITANSYFMIRGNQMLVMAAPTAGQTIAFEYVSNLAIAVTATPTVGAQSKFVLDTDVPLIDDECLKLECVWRYDQSRGFPYAEAMRKSELMIADRIARNTPKATIDLGRPARNIQRSRLNIPEGNWPG